MIRLGNDSVLQETSDASYEFDIFCDKRNLCADSECSTVSVSAEEMDTKEKALEKAAKRKLKCRKSALKDTLIDDWGNTASDIVADLKITHRKAALKKTAQVFSQETFLAGVAV